jgi:Bacterial Ig-like domain (group 1)
VTAHHNAVGTQDTVTVQVNDAGSQPLANAPVALSVLNGPNAGRNFTGVTDSTGAAVIQYSGTTQGNDLIQTAVRFFGFPLSLIVLTGEK